MIPDVTLVVPTFNERGNLTVLVERLTRVLAAEQWEVVFVDDDSTDGTLEELHALMGAHDNVRFLRRVGRRGLSTAVIEGLCSTAAELMVVMDADLQHDETVIPDMLARLRGEPLDVVVASRFLDHGEPEGLSRARRMMSRVGNWMSGRVTRVDLSDPLSGFFAVRRGFLDATLARLSGHGFKILVDLCASAPTRARVGEVHAEFRARHKGESKLDSKVLIDFAYLLAEKTVGRFVPTRFIFFCAVGLSGAVLHLSILGVLHRVHDVPFAVAHAVAMGVAMTSNFIFNNAVTYRDRRLSGVDFVIGLLKFYLLCALGAFVGWQLGTFLFDAGIGWIWAGLFGAMAAALWNFTLNSLFTWRAARV